jgi:hypothetical protein
MRAQYQQTFNDYLAQGYVPVQMCGYLNSPVAGKKGTGKRRRTVHLVH